MTRQIWLAGAALLMAGKSAFASGDGRMVVEPHLPHACVTLDAKFAATDNVPDSDAEQALDTGRIQAALDGCDSGQAVVLQASGARNAFVSGPLTLKSGVTLVINGGATLYASRNPRLYDRAPASCGVIAVKANGCKPFLSADHADHIGIMGDGQIDGQGGRTVMGSDMSWWQMARKAQKDSLNQNNPRLINITNAKDVTLYRISLTNSANFHLITNKVDGLTVWGVHINTPGEARNTDGIDPGSSQNVTIRDSFVRAGDDNVAIKAGGSGPSAHISLINNHFYEGHGLSIGSETQSGVFDVVVKGLTLDGTTNGIRIKSDSTRGGEVRDVSYSDVCMRGVRLPLDFDAFYSSGEGSNIPAFRDIHLANVHADGGKSAVFNGHDQAHSLSLSFDNVTVAGMTAGQIKASHARFTGTTNLAVPGVTPVAASTSCGAGVFVPFP